MLQSYKKSVFADHYLNIAHGCAVFPYSGEFSQSTFAVFKFNVNFWLADLPRGLLIFRHGGRRGAAC